MKTGGIQGDVACVACGYNLKGLLPGGNCPECGNPIASSLGRGRFLFKNLTDAPIGYLKTLRSGFFVLAGCIVALVAAIILAGWLKGVVAAGLVASIGVIWWAGVYLATSSEYPPGGDLSHKYDRLRWLRRANRTLQVAWTLAWVAAGVGEVLISRQNAAIAAGTLTPNALDPAIAAAGTVGWIMQLIGLISLVPLCVQFGEISNAAGHDPLTTRLGLSAWGIALFGAFSVVWYVFRGVAPILGFLMPIAGMGIFLSLVLLVICLIELAVMCGWAVANSRAAVARDKRVQERARRHEEEVQARLAEMPAVMPYKAPAVDHESPIPLEPER